MKDLTKVLFWYGPVELATGPFKKLNGPLIFFMQRTIQDFHVKNNFIDIFKYSDILLDILSHTLRCINPYFETYSSCPNNRGGTVEMSCAGNQKILTTFKGAQGGSLF